MVKKNLSVHSENILPIIKKWLYSDRDIFVRELISNASDALQKVKVLRDQGALRDHDEELRIDIHIDAVKKTLSFEDNGIGMTAAEVERFLAEIAFSGAKDFAEKYQKTAQKDLFIGNFGLGFFSAFMVASKVEVNTLSYIPGAEPALFISNGELDYDLEKGTREKRGTTVTLHLDEDEYLDRTNLKQILKRFASFLSFPIYLDGERLNTAPPLWIKPPNSCTKKDYEDFFKALYPHEEMPLFWVHLNVDFPFHLKGILYFPRLHHIQEWQKGGVKLYCNRVFVSDDCKDVLPEWLTALRGVIDSPDIPLNVSRSYLQSDRTVKQLASHVVKKVADALFVLHRDEKARFMEMYGDLGPVLKIGSANDEKFFERVESLIFWKTEKNEMMTAEEYVVKNGAKIGAKKIFYTPEKKPSGPLVHLYEKKHIDILSAPFAIDPLVMQMIERKHGYQFQRIDAAVDDMVIDKTKEKAVLDAEGKTEGGRLADLIRKYFQDKDITVEAKSLASDHLTGIVVMDEAKRRFRDWMSAIAPEGEQKHLEKKTFVVNTNSPLMKALFKVDAIDPALAKEMALHGFDLALLTQKELPADQLETFLNREHKVLERLVDLLNPK